VDGGGVTVEQPSGGLGGVWWYLDIPLHARVLRKWKREVGAGGVQKRRNVGMMPCISKSGEV